MQTMKLLIALPVYLPGQEFPGTIVSHVVTGGLSS